MGINNISIKNGINFCNNIRKSFGNKYFALLTTTYIGTVGAIYSMIMIIQFPYYRLANMDATVQNDMSAIALSPQSCKGFIGVLCDCYPIFGKSKQYYLFIFTIIGVASCTALAFLPVNAISESPIIPAIFFFGLNLYSASFDLIMESKNIELYQKNVHVKSALISYSWFCELVGSFIPTLTVAFLAQADLIRVVFYIFLPICFLPIIPILMGGVIYDNVPSYKSFRIDFNKVREEWRLILLAVVQALFAFGTIVVAFFFNSLYKLIILVCMSFIIILLGYMLLDRTTANFCLYFYISQSLYVNLNSPLNYFYTAEEDCVPNGVRFDYIMTTFVTPLVKYFGMIAGVILFQSVFSHWKFRTLFWASTLLRIVCSISDLIVVQRWNRAIYLPDELVYLLGYSTFNQIAYMLDYIPTIYFMAKIAPKGLEASNFALLSGLFQFGGSTAYFTGSLLMDVFNIKSIVDPKKNLFCDFSNLSYLILIGHFILPAISIPLVFVLIPKYNMTDELRHNYENTDDKEIKEVS